MDLSAEVSGGNEQGLLGVAFHPGGDFLYLDWTDRDGDTHVTEWAFKDGKATGRRDVLTQEQPYANHNGGQLAFGPDGYLYIGIGDGGSGGDPQGNGQNLDTLLGKILRIDVDARPRRTRIPADNPFVGTSGRRAGDLGVRPAQPLALHLRPRDRRPVDRRRRPERAARRSTSSRRARAARTTAGTSRRAPHRFRGRQAPRATCVDPVVDYPLHEGGTAR